MIFLFTAGFFSQPFLAHAQSGSAFMFSSAELDLFPTIRFYVDILDANGAFVKDLQPGEVEIIENGQSLQPDSVTETEHGLQLIVAINTDPSLGVVNNGITGYQRIQQAIQSWAASLPNPSLDDFSLATPTGLYLIRSRDPQEFIQAVSDYQPDFQKSSPSVNSLAEALDLTTDPPGRALLKRSILFITPALPVSSNASLPDLAVRAQEIGVSVHVWMIGRPVNLSEGAPDPLMQFAEATGGKYFQILSTENLPAIEPMFLPMRHTYQVEYQSAIQSGGSHSIRVRVNTGSGSIESDALEFNLDIQPPNPIFLSPPAQVSRTWTLPEDSEAPAVLTPDTVPLQIVVEFPDGRARPLRSTRLYVDGKVVLENTAEPFDRFDWPVTDETTPVRRLIRVEVIDSLGLSGTSSDIPVDFQVDQPAQTRLVERFSDNGVIAVAAVAVSGMVLGLILVLTNTQRRFGLKRRLAQKKREKDPLTQPVAIQPVSVPKTRTLFGKTKPPETGLAPFWPRSNPASAPARLVALDESEQPITGGGLPLQRQEITFGSDPKRATQVLNSPTVDGLHARLYRTQEGEFFLADQNSIAGTWINYAPVASAGARLEHGDLIHIGKVMFRFELSDPSQTAPVEVKITHLE